MKNLSKETQKKIVVSRSKRAGMNILWIIWGIFLGVMLGWSMCHYFVNQYGGEYPNVSVFKFILDSVTSSGSSFIRTVGIGSVPTFLTGLYGLYKKIRKDDKDGK